MNSNLLSPPISPHSPTHPPDHYNKHGPQPIQQQEQPSSPIYTNAEWHTILGSQPVTSSGDSITRTFAANTENGGSRPIVMANDQVMIQIWTNQPFTPVQTVGETLEQVHLKTAKSQEDSERKIKELESKIDDLKFQLGDMKDKNFIQEKNLGAKELERLEYKNKRYAAEEEQTKIATQNNKIRKGMTDLTPILRELLGRSETDDGDTEQQQDDVTGEKTLKELTELVEETRHNHQSLVEEGRRLGKKSENQEQELNAMIRQLKDKDAEIDTYKHMVTEIEEKYKTTHDQAAETQRQNDKLRQENQTLSTQVQDLQQLHFHLEEQNNTLKIQQRRQVHHLRAALVTQQRRRRDLIRTCRQLQQQQNNIYRERDGIRQENGDLVQEIDSLKEDHEKEVDFFIHQICTLTEPTDLSSLLSLETTEPDKTSSAEVYPETRFPHRNYRARTSTGRRFRARKIHSMRMVRNETRTYSEFRTRNGQWKETTAFGNSKEFLHRSVK